MTPQFSHTTRLSDYIAFMLPWAHGHQLKGITDFVAAIMEQQTACQAQLARYFDNQEAALKRWSRPNLLIGSWLFATFGDGRL